MQVISTVKNGGQISKQAQALLLQYLLKREGKAVEITVKDATRPSLNQYGYLYGVVYPILGAWFTALQGVQYSVEDVDYFLKDRFLSSQKPDPVTGEIRKFVNLKRKASKSELSAYIEQVLHFASEQGIEIPPAGEYDTYIADIN